MRETALTHVKSWSLSGCITVLKTANALPRFSVLSCVIKLSSSSSPTHTKTAKHEHVLPSSCHNSDVPISFSLHNISCYSFPFHLQQAIVYTSHRFPCPCPYTPSHTCSLDPFLYSLISYCVPCFPFPCFRSHSLFVS